MTISELHPALRDGRTGRQNSPSVRPRRPTVHPSIRLASRVGRIFIGLLRRRAPSLPPSPSPCLNISSSNKNLNSLSLFLPWRAGEWVRPTSPFLGSPVPSRTRGTRETEDTKLI